MRLKHILLNAGDTAWTARITFCLGNSQRKSIASYWSGCARRRFDEVKERPQWGGYQTPAGVIEERAGKARPPGFEHRFKLAAIKMRLQPILKQIDYPGSRNCRFDGEIGRAADGHDQGPGRINADNLAGALELPRQNRPAVAEAAAQARWSSSARGCVGRPRRSR
jgi:hypothetical protein